MAALTEYVDRLDAFIKQIQDLGLPVNQVLPSSAKLIRDSLSEATAAMAGAKELREAFVIVQQRKGLTAKVDNLLKQVEATRKVRHGLNQI